jgi:hypothetical protein
VGDFNGDGKTDIGVYRAEGNSSVQTAAAPEVASETTVE